MTIPSSAPEPLASSVPKGHSPSVLPGTDPRLAARRSQQVARLKAYIISALADMVVIGLAFACANILVLGDVRGEPGKPHGLIMFAMLAPVFVLLAVKGGTYGIHMLHNPRGSAIRALSALAQAMMLFLIIVYLGKIAEQLSRLTFVAGMLLSAGGLVAIRPIISRMEAAVVGSVPHLTVLIRDGVDQDAPIDVLPVDARALDIDPTRLDAVMAARLAQAVGAAERVVVACSADRVDAWRTALASLAAKGEVILPDLKRFGAVGMSNFDSTPTVVVAGGPLQFRDRIIKRLLDILVSASAIIILSPLLIGAAIAVRLSGSGPILFRQPRLGRDARPFNILKFRTMHHHMGDVAASKLTEKNDARITRVGAFLRKSSIDELPQLFNVLIGDMSVVGPRPHAAAAKAADSLYWEVDERYWARHCIKPGMTGLAQVRGHRGPTDRHEDLINRLQSDLEYVTDWSIWRDLRIIVATLGVLAHDNAY